MDIKVNTTRKFQEDLESFDKGDQKQIIDFLEVLYKTIVSDKKLFFNSVSRLRRVALNGYESSLRVAKIGRFRVFMTVDDDPIFDATLITLMRVTNRSDLISTYKSIAESLLQKQFASVPNR